MVYPSDLAACPVDNSSLRSTSELIQGLIIRGKYEILEKIGSGGMASVYRARHMHFDEIRALKVARSFLAEDETFVRRLRAEAVISRKLRHPNAVHVDDLDTLEDGRPFIVMEYVEGPDLRRVIQSTGPLPLQRVIDIGRQVALALGAAHRLHIIHRDIKPDNIRLVQQPDGSEVVKVLDFGIAKLQGAAAQTGAGALTMTGMVVCTPDYASPEQARGASSSTLDGRSDIYSLGIVMYEMLTGDLPFHSDTPIGMLMAQISMPPRMPSDIKPGLNIPDEVSDVLLKCLEKNPADRYQSADELIEALDGVASSGVTRVMVGRGQVVTMPPRTRAATLPPQPTPEVEEQNPADHDELTSEIRQAQQRQRVAIRYLAVAAVVLLMAGLVWWLLRGRGATQAQATPATEPVEVRILADVKHELSSVRGADKIVASLSAGTVHLSGQAASKEVVDEAALRTARISGVADVDKSGVRIAPPPPAPATAGPIELALPAPGPNATATPAATAANGAAMPIAISPPAAKYGEKPEVEQLLAQVRQERDQAQFDKALEDCDAALRLDPHSPAARREKQKTLTAKKWFDANNQ